MAANVKACKPHERLWGNFCVDKHLEDPWLERLNALTTLNLINICEGHYDRSRLSERSPHLSLRLKACLMSDIAKVWEAQKMALLNHVHGLFDQHDTNFNLALTFNLRVGLGRLGYRENLTLRVRHHQARTEAAMDAQTRMWFEQTVARLEELDAFLVAMIDNA
jgi:hypothetical protein